MKIYRAVIILALCLAALHAETRLQRWGRRALAVGACAASAVDGYDTATMDRRRFSEGNPLLSNSDGSVRIGRMVSIKVAACAIPLVLGEMRWKREAWIGSAGMLGVFTVVDVRNHVLIGEK